MKRSDFIDYLLQFAPENITENEMDVLEQFAFKIFDGTELNESFSLREKLNKTEAKRDLEQQAKGIDELLACRELDGFSQGAIDTIILIVNRLRKQANEVGR